MILTREIVIEQLKLLQDNDYQKFSLKLIPDTCYSILGVRVPKIRELVKKYQHYDVKDYLKNPGFQHLEEVQFYGLLLNKQKYSFSIYQNYLQEYITYIDNWATCDIFCADIKIKEKALLWNFILPYLNSEKEFEVRFGIVTILNHFIEEKNLKAIIDIIENIQVDKYYVNMAIAWLLSIMFIKYPEYIFDYLKKEPRINKFTYNKTLSKITDSYRVSDYYKEILRKMHIK